MGNKMRRGLLALFLLVLLLHCGGSSNSTPTATITTDEGTTTAVNLEIADSESERAEGLMYRESLAESAGMLFIWPEDASSSFWMKNTYISLDIIFIDSSSQVVFIAENTTPLSEDLITPTSSFRYVLEVNAGFSADNGLSVGETIDLKI